MIQCRLCFELCSSINPLSLYGECLPCSNRLKEIKKNPENNRFTPSTGYFMTDKRRREMDNEYRRGYLENYSTEELKEEINKRHDESLGKARQEG